MAYKQFNIKPKDTMTEKMLIAAHEIHQKVTTVFEILHRKLNNFDLTELNSVEKYPVPY